MPYSLRRERDGAGDSGQMSVAITLNGGPCGEHLYEHGATPKVGALMQVGSLSARSYSAQDYWQTTPITEILEERTDPEDPEFLWVRFKTGNSIYEWKRF
jgi:hypothetical protein